MVGIFKVMLDGIFKVIFIEEIQKSLGVVGGNIRAARNSENTLLKIVVGGAARIGENTLLTHKSQFTIRHSSCLVVL